MEQKYKSIDEIVEEVGLGEKFKKKLETGKLIPILDSKGEVRVILPSDGLKTQGRCLEVLDDGTKFAKHISAFYQDLLKLKEKLNDVFITLPSQDGLHTFYWLVKPVIEGGHVIGYRYSEHYRIGFPEE